MAALDSHLPDYEVNEVHEVALAVPAETALELALALPVGSDWIVRWLFRLRGLRSTDLPIEDG